MIYEVIRKSDGQKVYEYQSDQPIEWAGMEFAEFDHAPSLVIGADGVINVRQVRVWTKLEYLRLFTQAERIAIRNMAAQSPELTDYLELLSLAEEIHSDDADIIGALSMLELVGVLAAGRAEEVLNG